MSQLIFHLEPQLQDNWCWAAVASAIATFSGDPRHMNQCDVAAALFPGRTCCGNPDACDEQASLGDALTRVQHLAQKVRSPVSYDTVCTEIAAGRPLCVRVRSGGVGHFVVVSGFADGDTDQRLSVDDPKPARGRVNVPYDALLTNYFGSGVWTHTYFVR